MPPIKQTTYKTAQEFEDNRPSTNLLLTNKIRSDRKYKGQRWRDSYLFDILFCAFSGMNQNQIENRLKVKDGQLNIWFECVPFLKWCYDYTMFLKGNGDFAVNRFFEYVYGCLPDELKHLWNNLKLYNGKNDRKKVADLLLRTPKQQHQHLFIHAYIHCHFKIAHALKFCGLSLTRYYKWMAHDSEFKALMEQVEFYKVAFFEDALIDLVQERNPKAVMFVNERYNSKYKKTLEVNVSGNIEHNHKIEISNTILESLSHETRLELFEVLERNGLLKEGEDNVIDMEKNNGNIYDTRPKLIASESL
jgi:hypothetical protein